MPPRKRARVSRAASPSTTPQPTTPTHAVATPTKTQDDDIDVLNDPWTDEEEIGLFKGLVRWKPTGIHKHFRMLQLRNYLLENRYIHARSAHTKIPGIWRKLESLYDLEALDEREDARQLSDISDDNEGDEDEDEENDIYSLAANKIHRETFTLPGEDYWDLMWAQRVASEKERRDESPLTLPELNLATQPPIDFTPTFSVEPDEVSTPIYRAARGRPPKSATRGRGGAASARAPRRSIRQGGSVAADSEEPDSDDNDDGKVEDSEEEDEDSEASASTPGPQSNRGTSTRGRRGRPPGRRGKRR